MKGAVPAAANRRSTDTSAVTDGTNDLVTDESSSTAWEVRTGFGLPADGSGVGDTDGTVSDV